MSIDRYGITILFLNFKIYFYGIIIMSGVVAATIMAYQRAARYKQEPERAWDMVTWAVIGGVVGARIWHILTPSPSLVERGITTLYYLQNPLEMINIREGGLGIVGGVIGGALAIFIYVRINKISFLTWTDIIAPGLILAQAIGRWGNFMNQELYGAPTNLPWGLYISPDRRLAGFGDYEYFHPTFFYESLLNLIGMGLIIWVGNRYFDKLKKGDLFLVYLIYYPIVRVFMEMLRLDSSTVAGLNANQVPMAVVAALSALVLLLRHVLPQKPALQPVAVIEPESKPEETENA